MVARDAVGVALILAGTLCLAVRTSSAADDERSPMVVVLHSYRSGDEWSDSISRGILRAFREHPERINVRFEFMDARQIASAAHYQRLHGLLETKYSNVPVDLVIASDDNALQFLTGIGKNLFPDTPLIFCSVRDWRPSLRDIRPMTGLTEEARIQETIQAALDLEDDVRDIVVVTDQSVTSQIMKDQTRRIESQFTPGVQFRYIEDQTVSQLRQTVTALGPESIVLLFSLRRDSSRSSMSDKDDLEYVAPYSTAPIYSVWAPYLGHGIVGGNLLSGELEGQQVGEMALEVLAGRNVRDIPIATSPTQFRFDWVAMQRFGLSESRLPPGSEVINRPYSFYRENRTLVWAVAGIVVLLTALVTVLSVNIALRHRAQRMLRRYQDIVSSSTDMIGFIDRHYLFRAANKALLTAIGKSRQETIGHSVPEILGEEGFTPEVKGRIDRCLDGEMVSTDRWVDLAGIGRRRLNIKYVPAYARHGGIRGVVFTLRDITDEHQRQEQQLVLETQVQQTQKLESLGVLAGGIAHDFNNLLMGMMGNAELAMSELPPDSPGRPFVEDIRRSANRAADLCRQLLAYSGKGRFVVQPLDLSELVREMGKILEVSISKKIRLRYLLADALPAIEADATQIRQIVMNLITNASDAIGDREGTITIHTGQRQCDREYLRTTMLTDELTPGQYVSLEVSDNGCGMDARTVEQIFEPFYTTKFTGRGLGLAAVLGIVRGHAGCVRVHSEPGRGTRFHVLLPASPQAPVRTSVPAPGKGKWEGGGKVLLADDEEVVRRVAARMLESLGFEPVLAENGQQAVDLFLESQSEVRCVILDMTMPRLDGEETFSAIRQACPDAPIIISSGYDPQETAQRFVGRGPASFIQKPFQLEDLRRELREALS